MEEKKAEKTTEEKIAALEKGIARYEKIYDETVDLDTQKELLKIIAAQNNSLTHLVTQGRERVGYDVS